MKKIYLIVISISIILTFGLFLKFYIRHDHPNFFEDEIENYKNDRGLMVSIGGFKSFTYEFNKNQLKEDTLVFRIVIIGKKRDFVVVGEAIKTKDDNWIIFDENTNMSYDE